MICSNRDNDGANPSGHNPLTSHENKSLCESSEDDKSPAATPDHSSMSPAMLMGPSSGLPPLHSFAPPPGPSVSGSDSQSHHHFSMHDGLLHTMTASLVELGS